MLSRRVIGDFAFMVFAWLLLCTSASANETWRVWLEPKFMRAAVTAPIIGAQKTELAAGTLTDGGLTALTKPQFSALGMKWEEFSRTARKNAAADLASLKPRYERDAKKVIVYAALESERPIVASAVLAPGFLRIFEETLGEKLLMVVPNRFTAFVFPALATEFAEFSPLIFRAFRETAWPVSVEVFEVSAGGWRCVGAYEEP